MTTTVKTIVEEYLREHGFDGLFNEYECGCELTDLMPCGLDGMADCKPGYKIYDETDFCIVSKKVE